MIDFTKATTSSFRTSNEVLFLQNSDAIPEKKGSHSSNSTAKFHLISSSQSLNNIIRALLLPGYLTSGRTQELATGSTSVLRTGYPSLFSLWENCTT
jgi:hypothetical protein